jgi:hypothetical protein
MKVMSSIVKRLFKRKEEEPVVEEKKALSEPERVYSILSRLEHSIDGVVNARTMSKLEEETDWESSSLQCLALLQRAWYEASLPHPLEFELIEELQEIEVPKRNLEIDYIKKLEFFGSMIRKKGDDLSMLEDCVLLEKHAQKLVRDYAHKYNKVILNYFRKQASEEEEKH